MKYITFIRHAKSQWNLAGENDHERELNERGVSDAAIIGKELLKRDIIPQAIYSSSAVRALSTAQIIEKNIGKKDSIIVDENLYLFSRHTELLLDKLRQYDDTYKSIYVVSHNETLEMLAYELSNGDIHRFPTCSVLHCEVAVDKWKKIKLKSMRHTLHMTPKMFKD